MKKIRNGLALLLAVIAVMSLCACNSNRVISYKVIGETDKEEFQLAFRQDDPLCEIITAAMKEITAEGQLSRLSAQYLGGDYTCFPDEANALAVIEAEVVPDRMLRIGVQDGIAPLCSSREDGTFTGLIPDIANLVASRLGWHFEFMAISSENIEAELGSGNIDCAWMAASYQNSKLKCSFSPGWITNTHEIIVRSNSGINRKKALKGKILGVTDATSVDALKADGLDAIAGAVWYYDDLSTCFNALAAGDCDAVVMDSIVSNYYY